MEKPEMKMKGIFYVFGIGCAKVMTFRKRDDR
jgi:hypothetical protein